MRNEEILKIAGETLDQGLYFGKGKITRATDDEIIRFAFKLEMQIRKRLSEWLLNNYQSAGSISDICDHIMDQTK
jgi:hypothetical protein